MAPNVPSRMLTRCTAALPMAVWCVQCVMHLEGKHKQESSATEFHIDAEKYESLRLKALQRKSDLLKVAPAST